jgi:chromosome partitioning protein
MQNKDITSEIFNRYLPVSHDSAIVRDNFSLGLKYHELANLISQPPFNKLLKQNRNELKRGLPRKSFLTALEVRKDFLKRGFKYSKKARRIALLMCKGGVGKTTIAYFLGLRLASYGARVLFIDSDPQSNLTLSLRLEGNLDKYRNRMPVLVDVLSKRVEIQNAILKVSSNLHIIPSTAVNSLLERDLLCLRGDPIQRLDAVLQSVDKDYDYIIIDCAPTLNIFNASVSYASDLLLLPFQLNEFSKIGLLQTVSEIHDLEKQFMFKTKIKAVLNFYDMTNELGRDYLQSFSESFRSLFMQSVIRQSPEIQRALTYREDFFKSDLSYPKEDFDRLALEILSSPFTDREHNAQHG